MRVVDAILRRSEASNAHTGWKGGASGNDGRRQLIVLGGAGRMQDAVYAPSGASSGSRRAAGELQQLCVLAEGERVVTARGVAWRAMQLQARSASTEAWAPNGPAKAAGSGADASSWMVGSQAVLGWVRVGWVVAFGDEEIDSRDGGESQEGQRVGEEEPSSVEWVDLKRRARHTRLVDFGRRLGALWCTEGKSTQARSECARGRGGRERGREREHSTRSDTRIRDGLAAWGCGRWRRLLSTDGRSDRARSSRSSRSTERGQAREVTRSRGLDGGVRAAAAAATRGKDKGGCGSLAALHAIKFGDESGTCRFRGFFV